MTMTMTSLLLRTAGASSAPLQSRSIHWLREFQAHRAIHSSPLSWDRRNCGRACVTNHLHLLHIIRKRRNCGFQPAPPASARNYLGVRHLGGI